MTVHLQVNKTISLDQFIDVYRRSGIKRPVDDPERMQTMMRNSNLIISAWDEDSLVGVARCLMDYAWACYLSDLLVDKDYQHLGLGKRLVASVREQCGEQCQLVLLSAPTAMTYYPKVGFEKAEHAFHIKRESR